MKLGDKITGKIVGFRYAYVNETSLCFIDVYQSSDDTTYAVLLGNADAYPFAAMLSLRKQGTLVSAECTNVEKEWYGKVTFDV